MATYFISPLLSAFRRSKLQRRLDRKAQKLNVVRILRNSGIRSHWGRQETRLLILLLTFLVTGCSTINSTLKAPPIPETEFVQNIVSTSAGELAPDTTGIFPFHHAWDAGRCYTGDRLPVFIDIVDVSHIANISANPSRVSKQDLEEIADYARRAFEKSFSKKGPGLALVDGPPPTGRVIQIAIVELTKTDVARNVIGTALSALVPGGGIFALQSSGTIAIEGIVRDAASGKPLFVFADRERGKTAPFSFRDFALFSHARSAIDDWANQLAQVCTVPRGTHVADSSALTLSPL